MNNAYIAPLVRGLCIDLAGKPQFVAREPEVRGKIPAGAMRAEIALEDGDERAAEKIRAAKPGIVWVGLGTPKQERFMARYLPRLGATVMIGVGAAFDFHTGRLRQAPRWMQRCGLEWFFRLCMEPRRLWRRYLVNNPLFLFRIALQLLHLKKFEMDETAGGQ